MYGSSTFKWVWGKWNHISLGTTYLAMPSVSTTPLPIGTPVEYKSGDTEEAVLASGKPVGIITERIDASGTTSDARFKSVMIGERNIPIKTGTQVAVRVPQLNALLEFEGLGAAAPGNLVCTSGTGAISTSTANGTELSAQNGSIRVAQTGDIVFAKMEVANLTPETVGNVRIRVSAVPSHVKA